MIAHATVYVLPTSAVAGPLICGTAGVSHGGVTVTNADAVAPPSPAGSAALTLALPTPAPVTLKSAEFDPAGMTTEGGTVTTLGLDEESVTVVGLTTFLLTCALSVVDLLTSTERVEGRICSESCGMLIAPLTRVRLPPTSDFVPP